MLKKITIYTKNFVQWFTDSFRTVLIRKELEELKIEHYKVKTYLSEKGHLESYGLMSLNMDLKQSNLELQEEINLKRTEVVDLNEKILLEAHGFYNTKYNLGNSEKYREKLEQIQESQKTMIKNGTASTCSGSWTVSNSKKSGDKMVKDNQKLILRCFNNECEASIAKVKHNTIEAAEKKIQKAYEAMNKFGTVLMISITNPYLQLKLQELYVAYEYELKKQEEKEEAALNREKIKEAAKIEKEINEARTVNEKEKKHFENRLRDLNNKLKTSNMNIFDQQRLIDEKNIAEAELQKCIVRDKELDYREQNASAGYVYIISNLGAFGENVFKIGVTRRLDPTDRIDELGSASVPFRFDTHAVIFSENAFQLENALHKAFHHKRVNLINNRKEFFQLNLEEVNKVLKANFNKHFELKLEADATDFRESKKLREAGTVNA